MKKYVECEAAKLRIFEYGVKHRDNVSIASACENLERQINSIPAADVRPVEWIPVTERLPKNGESVLVYRSGDNRISSTMRIDVCPYLGDGVFCLLGVTHWMPLPEPPKEGDV